jgi:large subunit ribosomal protein L6
MSRIGNKPIVLPGGVSVKVGAEHGGVEVVGPRGSLSWSLPTGVSAEVSAGVVSIARADESRSARALHGLSRAILANMVRGVSDGFVRDLEIQGVGFKAAVKGGVLDLALGFSHPLLFQIPTGVKVTVSENTKIRIEGVDKQLVGQVAADIRSFYPPEPYKGKGVRYAGEHVNRKEGKTVQ